jgi:hypothetical protein
MIETVVKYLNKHGITNPIVQRAILATIGKNLDLQQPEKPHIKQHLQLESNQFLDLDFQISATKKLTG